MTNDTNAPERIWAVPAEPKWGVMQGVWDDQPDGQKGETEYLRADLALAREGALLERAAVVIDLVGDLGRAAFYVCDSMEDDGKTLTAWRKDFDTLSDVLEEIDEKTPEQDDQGTLLGTGARLQFALKTALTSDDATAALAEIVQKAVEAERERCARVVDKRAEEYDREHGSYDCSTGVTEYPGNGEEWMEEWETLAAAIRAGGDDD